jgi:dephospho-CoA kinase
MNTSSNTDSNKTVVGLVGGIASGKTTVAEMLEDCGALVVNADELAHEALEQPDIQEQIKTEFGEEFVSDGSVNRSMLSNVVFSDEEQIKKLNALIHPYVLDRIERRIRAFREQEEHSVLVLDVPLLVETDLHDRCDRVIFLDTPEEDRLHRVREHRDWSSEELKRREAAQGDLRLKRQISDCTIDTSTSLGDIEKRVSSLYQNLVQ